MRIAVFSDIHGNIYAFNKLVKLLKKEKPDFFIFCGDICGYYYHQNEVIEILKNFQNIISVLGNHDKMFLKLLNNEHLEKQYAKKFGKSSSILKKTITPESLTFLRSLDGKSSMDKYKIAIFHGSPRNHLNGYVYPADSLSGFDRTAYRYILLGHTHYAMDRIAGKTHIINPGSCGQPRDGNEPSYALLDYHLDKVTFKRFDYDTKPLIKDTIKHSEKNPYLTKMLER